MTTLWVVKNTNGAILGGFRRISEAYACMLRWERRYRECELVGNVHAYVEGLKRIA